MKEVTQRANIDWNRTRNVLPLLVNKHRLEVEKLRVQRSWRRKTQQAPGRPRSDDRHRAGRRHPLLRQVRRGKWSSMQTETLRRGATVTTGDVVMTVVKPQPLVVRASVPEGQVQNASPGLAARWSRRACPARTWGHRAAAIGRARERGQFRRPVHAGRRSAGRRLMPGMTGEVRVLSYQKADALTIPPKAVQVDDQDPQKLFVYLVPKGGKAEKRFVTLGRRNDKQVEVLNGLADGDEILLERPKE